MYFPKNKGLITGIILVGIGGSSLIFTWIADSIINPNFIKTDPSTGFFPREVSERFYKYIFILTILIGILAVISFLMIFDQYKVVKEDKSESLINQAEVLTESNLTQTPSTPETQTTTKVEIEVNNPILQAFQHKQLWQLILMDFGTLCKH